MEYQDPVPCTDYLSKPERNSADRRTVGRSGNLPRACQNLKLQDKFKPAKRSLSYADFHHEITKNIKHIPHKFAGDPQKQQIGAKEVDEDEVIKHMSNLPSYLQRGETMKEKALNVGVLDWGLLEKWQYGQKQMPYRSNRYSPSSSNTSSSFSTDESSTHSSRGHSCSPTRQRTRRPSLQSHLSSSLMGDPSRVVKSSGECLRNLQASVLSTKPLNVEIKQCKNDASERKASHGVVSCDVPHSCPLFSGLESKEPKVEQLSCRDSAAASVDFPPGTSISVSKPLNMGLNPSRSKYVEAKKAAAVPVFSTTIKHTTLEQKQKKVTAERVRSISPFYRFAGNASKMSKRLSFNDSSETRNQRSTGIPSKAGTGNSRPSSGDALNSTGRSRSSPLRRLLDPLLKPKAENSNHSLNPLDRGNVPTDNACKSGEQVSVVRPAKVKLGMTGCKKITVDEFAMGKKHGPPSTVQALLRVAVRNGLPLYTFAVNNESNILAATAKMLSTEKNDGFSCIYTFFTIQDIKKRSGSWINQGGRGKSQDFVSNVVAQMKVSDSGVSNSTSTQSIGVRDFVLFSVDLRQADDQTAEFQPNNELAAIVVKFPIKTNSKEYLAGDVQCQPMKNQGSISTTVVLPSAVHSLPSKGGPSSLIERWISGGSCDCGGWDLGCKLRILTNLKKSSSSKGGYPATDRVELFPQGGLQENQQVLSVSPFKEGIYSVEFHSSLSVLQAFSICTAVLDTGKQNEVLESSHSVEEKSFGPGLVQNAETSGPSTTEGQGPRYVSYPPHSPVGRV